MITHYIFSTFYNNNYQKVLVMQECLLVILISYSFYKRYIVNFYVFCIHTGANCILSIKSSVFVINGSIEKKIKTLQLTNFSSDPALFKFETDLSTCPFSVQPAAGEVPANSNIQITLSFCPKVQRLYYKRIFCLIKYQVHLEKFNLILYLLFLFIIYLLNLFIIYYSPTYL